MLEKDVCCILHRLNPILVIAMVISWTVTKIPNFFILIGNNDWSWVVAKLIARQVLLMTLCPPSHFVLLEFINYIKQGALMFLHCLDECARKLLFRVLDVFQIEFETVTTMANQTCLK